MKCRQGAFRPRNHLLITAGQITQIGNNGGWSINDLVSIMAMTAMKQINSGLKGQGFAVLISYSHRLSACQQTLLGLQKRVLLQIESNNLPLLANHLP